MIYQIKNRWTYISYLNRYPFITVASMRGSFGPGCRVQDVEGQKRSYQVEIKQMKELLTLKQIIIITNYRTDTKSNNINSSQTCRLATYPWFIGQIQY